MDSMYDQSFSFESLRKIYEEENSKGNNIAHLFFPKTIETDLRLKKARAAITRIYKTSASRKSGVNQSRVHLLYKIIRSIKDERKGIIENGLKDIAEALSTGNFEFVIEKNKNPIRGKDVFSIKSNSVSYFAEKKIQKNIKNIYSVKPADRDTIVPQLRSVLEDKLPKFIIKTDIKEFYESIDIEILMKKIKSSQLLSYPTRKYIRGIINAYIKISGRNKGIPRGIGISSYLSELYLKDFDEKIKESKDLVFYSRYVDDIIMIFSSQAGIDYEWTLNSAKELLKKENLSLNEDANKTTTIKFLDASQVYNFDYLGYSFKFDGGGIKIGLAKKKIDKYKDRISSAVTSYIAKSKKQPKKALKELKIIIKFLTGNTKLFGSKKDTLIGIYNSNKWINFESNINHLDSILQGNLNRIGNPAVKKKFDSNSFYKGFTEKKFYSFSKEEISVINRMWNK